MTEKLLTVEQAAEYFAVSPQTVRAWEKAGRLKSVRLDRMIRFTQADLLAFAGREAQITLTGATQ